MRSKAKAAKSGRTMEPNRQGRGMKELRRPTCHRNPRGDEFYLAEAERLSYRLASIHSGVLFRCRLTLPLDERTWQTYEAAHSSLRLSA